MSKGKGKTAKVIAQEISLVTPPSAPSNPTELPFREWSDQETNAEKWQLQTCGKDKSKSTCGDDLSYVDAQFVHLPPLFHANQWKRPRDVYPNMQLSIFQPLTAYPDLITPNAHLLTNEFYRCFITTIYHLLHIGSSKKIPTEYPSPQFCTCDKPWMPWHHIYSNCKLKKGAENSPTVNNLGKYVVRLFWLGAWRKLYVDDLIPLNKHGKILLPVLQEPINADPNASRDPSPEIPQKKNKKDKKAKKTKEEPKQIVELWPLLLTKALLKLFSLSCGKRGETVDFDVLQCFTGWIPQKISLKDLDISEIWFITTAYCDHFRWPEEHYKSPKSKKKDKKGKTREVKVENEEEIAAHVVASCRDIYKIFDHGPCLEHDFLVERSRDIPEVRPPPRPELRLWQKFRYEKWAVEKGIIPPDPDLYEEKFLEIVSAFLTANPTTKPPDEKETKKSKKGSVKSKKELSKLEAASSIWFPLENIAPLLKSVAVYLLPSKFKYKTRISDVASNQIGWNHVVYPLKLTKTRNEPLYFFSDSPDYKLFVLSFSQTGAVQRLEKIIPEPDTTISEHTEHSSMDFCLEILQSRKAKADSIETEDIPNEFLFENDTRTGTVLILEKYAWNRNDFGTEILRMKTMGVATTAMDLPPGRNLYRLWIDTTRSFCVQIASDTQFTVGCLELFMLKAGCESETLIQTCFETATRFGKLAQSFGSPTYPENLRNFRDVYKPETKLSKHENSVLHACFYREIKRTVSEKFNENLKKDVHRALDVLFLEINTFEYANLYAEIPHVELEENEDADTVATFKLMQRSAVKIQAFFKGIYVRALMKKHKQEHKQHISIYETLKSVYSQVFSSSNRILTCTTLFRRLFEDPETSRMKNKFDLALDMDTVMSLTQYQANVIVETPSWVPMCRHRFFINTTNPLTIKINLFCNLDEYYVRVFDNDNREEIKRYTNNVFVEAYRINETGYTVLCYGYVDEPKKLQWRLVYATRKFARNDVLIVEDTSTTLDLFVGAYVPNKNNLLFRYLVKTDLDEITMSARMAVCDPNVQVLLKVLDTFGNELGKSTGDSGTVLPYVLLRVKNEDKNSTKSKDSILTRTSSNRRSVKSHQTIASGGDFFIEGYVKEDSWPLTHEEWYVVNNIRRKRLLGPDWYLLLPEEDSSEKTTSLLSKQLLRPSQCSNDTIEEPFWMLNTVFEAGDHVKFTKDRSDEEEIIRTKLQWYYKEPERYQRGQDLRTQYLEESTLEDYLKYVAECCGEEENNSYRNIQREENIRSLVPPHLQNVLNEDFSCYMLKPMEEIDVLNVTYKTERHFELDEEKEREEMEIYLEEYEKNQERIKEILLQQMTDFEAVNEWFKGVRNSSERMMETAANLRTAYITRILDSFGKNKKSGDDKKPKKKKK